MGSTPSSGLPLRSVVTWAVALTGMMVSVLPFSMLVGLGVHRHAAPWAISASAMVLTFAPPVMAALAARQNRGLRLGSTLWAWSVTLFLLLPVYFPGERRQAVATGLAIAGVGTPAAGLPERIAESLPDEPEVAQPEVAEASPLLADVPPPATVPLTENQIALPYEGEGRRLSVPVIFGNDGAEFEVDMLLDTGATYTTLSTDLLTRLGARPTENDPVMRLHTANGERDAQIVLLDSVWLGDLQLEGIAIATCDDCAGSDHAGLLGLNVAGAFNLSIDADRREVVFTRRATFDRKLDVRPFTDLGATFTRFPGGRVEVRVTLDNASRRWIRRAVTSVECGPDTWTVPIVDLPPGAEDEVRQRLPRHTPCDQYQIALHEADW